MNIDQDFVIEESRLTHISEKIAAIMGSHSLHLGEKRERLQNVLVGESDSYNEELERQTLIQAEALYEERKNRSLSSLVQVEAKRKHLAERQLELHSRQNNEELKINEAMQKCWEAAAYNKLKMEERTKVKATINQFDSTMDRLLQQHNLEQIGEEDKITRRRIENSLYDCAILKNQIIEKRLQIEEKILSDVEDYEHLKQLAKEYEEDEKQEILKKWRQKQHIAKEKHENMIYSIAKRKEKEWFEKELSKNYCQVHLISDEVRPSCSKEQLRLEQDLFLETQHNFKEEMRRAESHEDELRKIENSQKEETETKARLQEEIMKRKQYQEVLQTQIMQIMATTKLGNV